MKVWNRLRAFLWDEFHRKKQHFTVFVSNFMYNENCIELERLFLYAFLIKLFLR